VVPLYQRARKHAPRLVLFDLLLLGDLGCLAGEVLDVADMPQIRKKSADICQSDDEGSQCVVVP
jgi:hypothetical protein